MEIDVCQHFVIAGYLGGRRNSLVVVNSFDDDNRVDISVVSVVEKATYVSRTRVAMDGEIRVPLKLDESAVSVRRHPKNPDPVRGVAVLGTQRQVVPKRLLVRKEVSV
jgi:hypothetical protein